MITLPFASSWDSPSGSGASGTTGISDGGIMAAMEPCCHCCVIWSRLDLQVSKCCCVLSVPHMLDTVLAAPCKQAGSRTQLHTTLSVHTDEQHRGV